MTTEVRKCLERALELIFPDRDEQLSSEIMRHRLKTEFGPQTVRDTADHVNELLRTLEE